MKDEEETTTDTNQKEPESNKDQNDPNDDVQRQIEEIKKISKMEYFNLKFKSKDYVLKKADDCNVTYQFFKKYNEYRWNPDGKLDADQYEQKAKSEFEKLTSRERRIYLNMNTRERSRQPEYDEGKIGNTRTGTRLGPGYIYKKLRLEQARYDFDFILEMEKTGQTVMEYL